ncbi:MAG: RNA methyltransferase [Candidatus Diapherotrites archaeon]|nr:RNA methyltransferase [Candidatus Diapherotrites archaeon]
MSLRIILVEPEYEENLGLIARVCKNFGVTELFLVKPKANKNNIKAISRAMHAQDVLKKSKTTQNLKKALQGLDYSIAATARITSEKKFTRTALPLKQIVKKFNSKNLKLGLVFGRESSGLTNSEVEQCDLIMTIPTSHKYASLNISHAVAVTLYAFFAEPKKTVLKTATSQNRKNVFNQFVEKIKKAKQIDNPQGVLETLKALLNRVPLTEKELNSLYTIAKQMKNK